ncbi:FtsX-like permease family protein [Leptolyngbya sp. FACHB-671]|uniref:ABC transporter permease DevC n=1 Tax=unclassified Leptolyngbya TaxID=2650499 RepID=UPI0016827FBF|nr:MULTISPECIES: ABC transporter permease DevC [unclassified Leptolyngbya]MBD1998149.1 FtsX-like permease family protein [Leptolyngbya sp. FACHB-541]MBD2067826.1 FtsX-like permease family protein [Leptolyngbya sp. FACHB-671]
MSLLKRTPLAWLNLTHDRRRLLTSLGGVAFAVLLMFMFNGFKNALYDSQVQLLQLLNADIIITNTQKYNMFVPEPFARRRLYQARAFEGVEDAYPLYINTANWKNAETKATRPVRVLAFNPQDPVLRLPEVQTQLAKLQAPETVLIDLKSRPELGPITAGVETELGDRHVRVVGNYSLGTDFASGNGNLIMSDQNYLRYFAQVDPEDEERDLSTVDVGLVKIAENADPERIAAILSENLPKDVKVITQEGFVQQELTYWQENTNIGFVFSLLTTMAFIVGIILVYQILYTDVSDHWAEYATLKAMGYRNFFLLGVVLQEATILSILGFIPGFCISVLLYNATADATGLLMQMTTDRALSTLVATFIMCLISGAIAVRKVQATDPAEVFG